MMGSFTKTHILMIVILSSLGFEGSHRGIEPKGGCFKRPQTVFGKPAHLNPRLFAVNKDYALQFRVTRSCQITQVEVLPKYAWEELVPTWKEPDYPVALSEKEYTEILGRIGQVKYIGPLLSRGVDYAVTNSKIWPLDEYEQAFVQRVVHCCPKDDSGLIFSFSVIFNRRVKGKIKDVKQFTLPNGSKRIKVRINEDWYLISPVEFKKVSIGRIRVLKVAGPVS